jgi:hypothetical protein
MGRRGLHIEFVCEKPEGKPLGRSRIRWKYNIKIDLRGIGFGDMDWVDLA